MPDSYPVPAPHIGPVVDERSRRDRFAPHELAIVLSHYDVGVIRQIRTCPLGSRRAPKLRLKTDRGDYLLKRRAPGRDDPQRVTFAHDLQERLAESDYPVAALIRTRPEGQTMLRRDGRTYELFGYISGRRYELARRQAASAGAALGTMHRNLGGYRPATVPPARSFHAAPEADAVIARAGSAIADVERPDDDRRLTTLIDELRRAYAQASGRADGAGWSRSPEAVLHGDWHPGNLLFRDERVVGVLDFDSARVEARIADVANGALQFSMRMAGPEKLPSWPEGLSSGRMRSFLRGYDFAVADPLAADELAALPWLIIEALVLESVIPIAATGSFGGLRGSDFLEMVLRKVRWLEPRAEQLVRFLAETTEKS